MTPQLQELLDRASALPADEAFELLAANLTYTHSDRTLGASPAHFVGASVRQPPSLPHPRHLFLRGVRAGPIPLPARGPVIGDTVEGKITSCRYVSPQQETGAAMNRLDWIMLAALIAALIVAGFLQ